MASSDKVKPGNDISQGLYAGLLEMVSELVWSISLDQSRILYINPVAEKIFGRPLADLSSQPALWLSCVDERDREILGRNLDRLPKLQSFAQEFRIIRPNGQKVWLKGQFRLMKDDDGKPLFIGASAKDESKRVTAERRLEESQAIYHSLVESLPINVFRKDLDGKVVFANRRYCDEMNLSLEELKGKTDLDLFPDMAPKYRKDDEWVLRTGLPFHDIESHPKGPIDPTGTQEQELLYVEVLKAPVTDASGRRIGIQGMFWDVTERKKAERALRDAKEIAESASRAKTDFLANVSHEIRTPMNGIIGITELLTSSTLNKEHRDYLGLINTSAESLLSIINDILDFSKIEAGKIQLESKRFLLRDSLGDTLRSLAVRAHSKQLELIVTFAPDVPDEIVGDLVRLRQVVVNLVSNAVKFTKLGQVELSVECVGCRDDQARLRFTVIDSGIGIPQDKLGSIFSEFEQADSSTTRQYGGTGLGLAIASKLVELMGGALIVESEIGRGSKFSFEANFLFDDTFVAEGVDELRGHKVLLVVENQMMRDNLKQTLKQAGLFVSEAADAKVAIQILNEMASADLPIEAVVCDAELINEDGSVFIERIRNDSSIAQTPAILLTNAVSSEMSVDRKQLGIEDILIKPVKEKDLLNSIALSMGLLSERTTEHANNDQAAGQTVSQLRVLLAEDNRVNQRLAIAILEKHGHLVDLAHNGRQAVLMFQQNHYDVILMDVQMPEMDGYQATHDIRQLQTKLGQRVPIIALTAHAGPADRNRCLAAGMDEYLAKPIRAQELFDLIEKQTGHRSTIASKANSEATNAGDSVDWEQAFDTVGGERKLLEELINVFLKDESKMLANIEGAIKQNDAKELRLTAHAIKGALIHLGGRQAASLAGELESMGKHEELAEAESVFSRFSECLHNVVTEMKKFLVH